MHYPVVVLEISKTTALIKKICFRFYVWARLLWTAVMCWSWYATILKEYFLQVLNGLFPMLSGMQCTAYAW